MPNKKQVIVLCTISGSKIKKNHIAKSFNRITIKYNGNLVIQDLIYTYLLGVDFVPINLVVNSKMYFA